MIATLLLSTLGLLAQDAHLPSPQQLAWQELQLGVRLSFACDSESAVRPQDFHPQHLDVEQWLAAAQGAGARYVILVAKGPDGFCLWPTETESPSISASPWRAGQGNLVAELAAACKERGLGFGLELSGMDRALGAQTAGRMTDPGQQARYDELFASQLGELLALGAEILEMRLPEGLVVPLADMRRPGWQRPLFLGGPHPDLRSTGAPAPYPLWNRAPSSAPEAANSASVHRPSEALIDIVDPDRGSGAGAAGLIPLDELLDVYMGTVNRGCNLLFDWTLAPDGTLPADEYVRCVELAIELRRRFGKSVAQVTEPAGTEPELILDLGRLAAVDHILLKEHLSAGQQVRHWRIDSWSGGVWRELTQGFSIGSRLMLRVQPVMTSKLRVVSSTADPEQAGKLTHFGAYEVGFNRPAGATRSNQPKVSSAWQWTPETVSADWQSITIDLEESCPEAGTYWLELRETRTPHGLEVRAATLFVKDARMPGFVLPAEKPLEFRLLVPEAGVPLRLEIELRSSNPATRGKLFVKR